MGLCWVMPCDCRAIHPWLPFVPVTPESNEFLRAHLVKYKSFETAGASVQVG